MIKNRVDTYKDDNPFEQLSDVVFNLLADDISTLTLKPGSKLNIAKIADELEVSRTPVREAALKLADAGYIEKVLDKQGYYVSELLSSDIKKINVIRVIIETKAVYICAKYKSFPGLENLKKLTYDIKEPYINLDLITAIDYNFHKQIVISTGNEYLIEFYKLIDNKVRRLLKLNFESFINDELNFEIDSIVTEHKTILTAIEQNMPEMAEKAMLDHINSSLNNSLLYLKSAAANL